MEHLILKRFKILFEPTIHIIHARGSCQSKIHKILVEDVFYRNNSFVHWSNCVISAIFASTLTEFDRQMLA
ncbi:uncharacterized protein PHALS_15407 [Plasmopara halstedii]|uniref:Uncharacterized protein n=1 Tax=Plasmopara halstedii TaxID=4781 RepID=A0A0P1AFP8_PLAHL|nr:uncharacterized protein PHALS_15407 [Plasmopara halstedii]CEG39852.1 hypothetical protein PHALS_15407 [Plasmopara halstedii]|eukprot:XP_024576221.1 hypothetical protein PHALS_15407 [Plasmopara halstedii]